MAETPFPSRPLALAAWSEAERERALARFRLLQPCLEAGVPLARLAREQGLALRTAQRWLARYRAAGLAGLARQPRADRHRRHLQPDLQRLIAGLALRKPPPTAAFVHRQVVAVARQQGWPVPSYACVYEVIRSLDPALVTLAHDGVKGYSEAFDLLHRHAASGPNAIWQADHTQLDLLLRNERGQPARPTR